MIYKLCCIGLHINCLYHNAEKVVCVSTVPFRDCSTWHVTSFDLLCAPMGVNIQNFPENQVLGWEFLHKWGEFGQ